MPKIVKYTLFFLIIVVLQVFFFGNLNMGFYLYPLPYIAFVILLPLEIKPFPLLLLGALLGLAVDLLSYTNGLHLIATLPVACARPLLLNLTVGRELVGEGGAPVSLRIGTGRFLYYAGVAVLLHSLIFFCFEALTLKYLYLTLLRATISAAATLLLVWVIQALLPAQKAARHKN